MTYFERIFDLNSGETIERQFSNAEIAAIEAAQKISSEQALRIENEAAAKLAEKTAIANKLGITLDELQTLLG